MSPSLDILPNQYRRSLDVFRASIIPVGALLVIAALVYGSFIPKLGFYQDDWPLVWVYHSLGAKGFAVYFKGNREIAGKVFSIVFPIIGTSIFRWHVVALLLRWLSSAFLFFAFRSLWPEREAQAWMVSVFALLYPGFSEQPMAVTFLPHQLSFLFFAISLCFTIWAIRSPRFAWLFTAVSVFAALLGYAVMDYFVGLEFLRPVIIAMALGLGSKSAKGVGAELRSVAIKWSPYAITMASYAIWRLFLHTTWPPTYDGKSQLAGIAHHPLHELLDRIGAGIQNMFLASAVAWSRVVTPDLADLNSRTVQLALGMGLIVCFISYMTLRTLYPRHREAVPKADWPDRNVSSSSFLILGLAALIVGGLPIAFANLRVAYDSIYLFDRYTLPYLLGASVLLVGICGVAIPRRKGNIIVATVLIFFAATYQIDNESAYRHDWNFQRSFFWQLAWRAPKLKSGTTIFIDHLPFSLRSDHSAGLLDLLYDGNRRDGRLDYFIFDLESLKNLQNEPYDVAGTSVPSFKADQPILGSLRSFDFRGSTSSAIVAWNSPSGTMRFVSQSRAQEISGLPPSCIALCRLSRISELVTDEDRAPDSSFLRLFGGEPPHSWTYYFQKAELGCDLADWSHVALLGDDVRRLGFEPSDPNEWMPFIEGYAMSGNYDRALEITEHVLQNSPTELEALSSLWRRIIGSRESEIKAHEDLWDNLQRMLILSPESAQKTGPREF
jgi:hypothetical protein